MLHRGGKGQQRRKQSMTSDSERIIRDDDGQHQHQLLTNIDELLNSSTDTDFPTENTNQNKLKKIVQQLVVTPSLNAWFAVTNQTNYSYQPFGFPTPFLPINNPPPEI